MESDIIRQICFECGGTFDYHKNRVNSSTGFMGFTCDDCTKKAGGGFYTFGSKVGNNGLSTYFKVPFRIMETRNTLLEKFKVYYSDEDRLIKKYLVEKRGVGKESFEF